MQVYKFIKQIDTGHGVRYMTSRLFIPRGMTKHVAQAESCVKRYGGFPKWGTPKWIVNNGKLCLNDEWMMWGYHHCRKPPC